MHELEPLECQGLIVETRLSFPPPHLINRESLGTRARRRKQCISCTLAALEGD